MRFILSEIAALLNGKLVGPDGAVNGVSIDSRSVTEGELFVPLIAERDGHEFIAKACSSGAGGYLTSSEPQAGSAIMVDDTAAGLTELGRVARRRLSGPVIGITGSVGKTSVKDMVRAVCSSTFVTHASAASFNNEIGLPLTLSNAPDNTEVAVVEMGARGLGHIAELCEIAQPTVGVVTTVALAHSELFGAIDQVAKAKGELIEALPADGVAVLNADNQLVAAMADRTTADVLTFGASGDVTAVDIELDQYLRPSFRLETPSGSAEVTLQAGGVHMATNASAAVAAGLAVGVPLESAVASLAAATVSPWRMEVAESSSGVTVINDAYNANPTSVRAALTSLSALPASKKVAVLGVMAELGPEGPSEHIAVVAEAVEAGIEVVAVAAPEYGNKARHVSNVDEAYEVVRVLGSEAAILVKGSRVTGLERLAQKLMVDYQTS